jgi:hypothetical protein
MKRLVLALVLAMTVLPFTAFGLEMMSDSNMKDVTAQAGVAIVADDIVLDQHVGVTKYIDTDGTKPGSTNETAAVTISARHRIQHINAVYASAPSATDPSLNPTFYTYGRSFKVGPLALTIDVGKCSIMSTGLRNLKSYVTSHIPSASYSLAAGGVMDRILHMTSTEAYNTAATNVVGVQIGLPTVEIYTEFDVYGIGVKLVDAEGIDRTDSSYHNDGREFIKIRREGSGLAILGGRVEIAPK